MRRRRVMRCEVTEEVREERRDERRGDTYPCQGCGGQA